MDVGWGAGLGAAAPGEGQGFVMERAGRAVGIPVGFQEGRCRSLLLGVDCLCSSLLQAPLAWAVVCNHAWVKPVWGLVCCPSPCLKAILYWVVFVCVFFVERGSIGVMGFELFLFGWFLGLKGFSALLPL